jgi:hypothetical protein
VAGLTKRDEIRRRVPTSARRSRGGHPKGAIALILACLALLLAASAPAASAAPRAYDDEVELAILTDRTMVRAIHQDWPDEYKDVGVTDAVCKPSHGLHHKFDCKVYFGYWSGYDDRYRHSRYWNDFTVLRHSIKFWSDGTSGKSYYLERD